MAVEADEFVRLARVKTIGGIPVDNVYTVGPFGSRVSFAYQQRRALTLVQSLLSTKNITIGNEIAVIGAGISGVTTALALIKKGMLTDVFEQNSKAIQIQAPSSHRYVHPSINFWPSQDVDPGTDFPFLNWHAQTADKIVTELRQEFETEISKGGTRTYFDTQVTNIVSQPRVEGGDRPRLDISTRKIPSGIVEVKNYHAILICTGFGVEQIVSEHQTCPYWEVDEIHAEEGYSPTVRAVSGLGDGAIIDALRQVHTAFKKGELLYETIVEIESSRPCKTAASEFNRVLRQTHIADQAEASRKANAKEIRNACNALLQRLPVSLMQKLDNSLKDRINKAAPNNLVKLIGPAPGPFQSRIAPIHLLLLAHAMEKGVIEWVEGRLEKDKVIKDSSSTDAPINCIIRHGPSHSSPFFDDPEILDLRQKQAIMGNWVNFEFKESDWLDADELDIHRARKYKLAERLYNNHFSNNQIVNLAINDNVEWVAQYEGEPLIPLPQKLFGRNIVKASNSNSLRRYTATE